jgi:hypothetical protein
MPIRHELPLPITLSEAATARDASAPSNDGLLAVALFCAIGLFVAVVAMIGGVQGVWL